MNIDTTFLRRCLLSLETALEALGTSRDDEPIYDVYRAACCKEFELVLEQSGKLLRMLLAKYFGSNRAAARLSFKDLFRYAAKHELIDLDAVERWIQYRDNRNSTVHDYGKGFAEFTLKLLPGFIADVQSLADIIDAEQSD